MCMYAYAHTGVSLFIHVLEWLLLKLLGLQRALGQLL